MIQFLLNDKQVHIESEKADLTLLNYLRDKQSLCGTKEGCASGDCGACTLVLSSPNAEQTGLNYKAINSCVTFLPAVHGKQVITVEHLADADTLHPVQQAMVDNHASQCGFCTPGFVMSIFALYHHSSNQVPKRPQVVEALSGNLCRCTGYRPIIQAALVACENKAEDKFSKQSASVLAHLNTINKQNNGKLINSDNVFLPRNRRQLAQLIKQFPQAKLVAGATDLALVHTQQLQAIDKLISLTAMPALQRIDEDEHMLSIGAACTLSDIQAPLFKHFPQLKEVIARFASVPIRNQATLGGNIANASPIGDMPPVLLALNASITLDNGADTRTLPINRFFTDYRQTLLAQNEWIDSIHIPLAKENQIIRVYKVSKRYEDDISAVCMAINLSLIDGMVSELSLGFGGIAATPVTCQALSEKLTGMQWHSSEALLQGKALLKDAFSPIDDVRARAEYRKQIVQNLWHRFWLESNTASQSISIRVVDHA